MTATSILSPVAYKTCTQCQVSKPSTAFRKKLDKLTSACTTCLCLANREYWESRSPAKKAKQAERRLVWNSKNPDKVIDGKRKWLKKYPERHKLAVRNHYLKSREVLDKKNQEWRKANPESVRISNNKSRKKMRENNPKFRLTKNFSSNVRACLASGKGGKGWPELVGYSLNELCVHIEKQFTKGMNWENCGKGWHIDHISPVASFSFKSYDDDQFKQCWSLANLRPFWAKDNMAKKDRITHLI